MAKGMLSGWLESYRVKGVLVSLPGSWSYYLETVPMDTAASHATTSPSLLSSFSQGPTGLAFPPNEDQMYQFHLIKITTIIWMFHWTTLFIELIKVNSVTAPAPTTELLLHIFLNSIKGLLPAIIINKLNWNSEYTYPTPLTHKLQTYLQYRHY